MQIDTVVFQTGMVEGISLSIDTQFLANFELHGARDTARISAKMHVTCFFEPTRM